MLADLYNFLASLELSIGNNCSVEASQRSEIGLVFKFYWPIAGQVGPARQTLKMSYIITLDDIEQLDTEFIFGNLVYFARKGRRDFEKNNYLDSGAGAGSPGVSENTGPLVNDDPHK